MLLFYTFLVIAAQQPAEKLPFLLGSSLLLAAALWLKKHFKAPVFGLGGKVTLVLGLILLILILLIGVHKIVAALLTLLLIVLIIWLLKRINLL